MMCPAMLERFSQQHVLVALSSGAQPPWAWLCCYLATSASATVKIDGVHNALLVENDVL